MDLLELTGQSPNTVMLIPIERCSFEDQMSLRVVRNQTSVRKAMFTTHEIS